MRKLFIISWFVFGSTAWANNYATEVFNKLVQSINPGYGTRPTLTIVPSDYLVAETYPTGEVKVGSRLIQLCRNFGKDSCNALAHVLSHELAHYYQNHAWMSNFTSAYANVEWSRKLSESEQLLLPVYETQADEMGFFYAFNAGYSTWHVAGQVLDSIYTWYELPAELAGYPPLEQRKKISAAAREKITSIMPLYKIASYFTLMGKYFPGETQYVYYQSASYCLDHLVHENIKTPNVLNNLGVLYFLQAQPYFYEPLNQLMYPVMLDDQSLAVDMSEVVGTRALTPKQGELGPEALDLLERSKDVLTQALKTDKKYLPANLNLCLVHFLLKAEGSLTDQLKYIKSINLDMDDATASVYWQMEAFANYLRGDTKKMNDAFKKSIKLNNNSAQLNHEVLTQSKSHTGEMMSTLKWPVDTAEKIFGKKVNEFFKTFRSTQETRLSPYHDKFILWTDQKPEGSIYTFRSQFSQTIYRDVLFFEVEDPNFSTTHGLQLGSPATDLEKLYGNPYYKNISAATDQYLYPSQSMIVTVERGTNTVSGIMYYGGRK